MMANGCLIGAIIDHRRREGAHGMTTTWSCGGVDVDGVGGVSGVSVDACRFLDVLLFGDFLEHVEFRSWGFSGVGGS